MWPDDRLQKLLGIELPIIQAPMAGSNGIDMAVAVSEAGGLGSLGCAPFNAAKLDDNLSKASEKTARPINYNFFTHRPPTAEQIEDKAWLNRLGPYYKELSMAPPSALSSEPIQAFDDHLCRVIEKFTPAVVSFHFGLPNNDLVRRVKATGAKLLSSATTIEEARWLEDQGCDAIIAQGVEAGGHRGMFLTKDIHSQMGTLSLVPQIADAVDVPVIAAGGIADGRGIAAAFALGASGVQIGTAYLFSKEATISDSYRATIHSARSMPTTLTNVISGRPTRVLVNRAVQELGPLSDNAPVFPTGFAAMAPLRKQAEQQGDRDFSAHYSGQSVSLGYATTARQLTLDLAADATRRLDRMVPKGS